jgi:hypothetical protein
MGIFQMQNCFYCLYQSEMPCIVLDSFPIYAREYPILAAPCLAQALSIADTQNYLAK